MRFGERLRHAREERAMSRRELADKSGVPFGTIHGYEDGRRTPSFSNVVKLAKALDTDCSAFSECEDVAGEPVAEEPPAKAKGKRK